MIKRIIFDLDNTLLNSQKDAIESYQEYFKNNEIDDYSEILYKAVGMFFTNEKDISIDNFIKYINYRVPFIFTYKQFRDIYDIYQKHVTLIEEDICDTLAKLSQKYELVILTNWYYEDQKNRCQNAKILKYFQKIYACEEGVIKPNILAYEKASYPYQRNECLIIGDDILLDYEIPKIYKYQVVLFDYNNEYNEKDKIDRISKLIDYIAKKEGN